MELILNDGELLCNKCNGTGLKPHDQNLCYENSVEAVPFCTKCNGSGKVDWITNAMGEGKLNEIYSSTNGSLYLNSINSNFLDYSDITFELKGKEMLRISESGFYIEGRKVNDDNSVFEGFKKFLHEATYKYK